ncbi:hypothetical protein BC936DRAFT_138687 [Jimgerdemannia flammicorona]|uniref:Uncharacterized protein n=1 Tax=Jimgerdemannia flammicorona TaxID=994334 RepID=A0A433BSL8_9FUNG|nr:hypothetical protein BC936DRAFT_138687 [Jimgerdemannia flammicorona]
MVVKKKALTPVNLSINIPAIFQEIQKTTAHHRKYSIALRKIQEQVALDPSVPNSPPTINIDGETAFNKEIARNLNKVLAIKKKEPCADRVVNFLSTFTQFTLERDAKKKEDDDEEMDDENSEQETISSRFVEFLMRHLLKGLGANDKMVRLRCCQLIALNVISLGEIE